MSMDSLIDSLLRTLTLYKDKKALSLFDKIQGQFKSDYGNEFFNDYDKFHEQPEKLKLSDKELESRVSSSHDAFLEKYEKLQKLVEDKSSKKQEKQEAEMEVIISAKVAKFYLQLKGKGEENPEISKLKEKVNSYFKKSEDKKNPLYGLLKEFSPSKSNAPKRASGKRVEKKLDQILKQSGRASKKLSVMENMFSSGKIPSSFKWLSKVATVSLGAVVGGAAAAVPGSASGGGSSESIPSAPSGGGGGSYPTPSPAPASSAPSGGGGVIVGGEPYLDSKEIVPLSNEGEGKNPDAFLNSPRAQSQIWYKAKNPGNIKGYAYPNMPKMGAYVAFPSFSAGIAEYRRLLGRTYFAKGCNTIRKIIYKYAPPDDGNDTEKYIRNVCSWSGLQENEILDYNNLPQFVKLAKAMLRQETTHIYKESELLAIFQHTGAKMQQPAGASAPAQASPAPASSVSIPAAPASQGQQAQAPASPTPAPAIEVAPELLPPSSTPQATPRPVTAPVAQQPAPTAESPTLRTSWIVNYLNNMVKTQPNTYSPKTVNAILGNCSNMGKMIQGGSQASGRTYNNAELNFSNIKPNMIIGIDSEKNETTDKDYNGIDHIVITRKDGNSGKVVASDNGSVFKPYMEVMNKYLGNRYPTKLYGVDFGKKEGEVIPQPSPSSQPAPAASVVIPTSTPRIQLPTTPAPLPAPAPSSTPISPAVAQSVAVPNPAPVPQGAIDMTGLKIVGRNVDLVNVNPTVKYRLSQMGLEFKQRFGRQIRISDGKRTLAQQEALFRRKGPGLAAKPNPLAPHICGLAIDMKSEDANKLEASGLFDKYGFWRPLKNGLGRTFKEPWHVEPKGSRDPSSGMRITAATLARFGGGDPNAGMNINPNPNAPASNDNSGLPINAPDPALEGKPDLGVQPNPLQAMAEVLSILDEKGESAESKFLSQIVSTPTSPGQTPEGIPNPDNPNPPIAPTGTPTSVSPTLPLPPASPQSEKPKSPITPTVLERNPELLNPSVEKPGFQFATPNITINSPSGQGKKYNGGNMAVPPESLSDKILQFINSGSVQIRLGF